LLPLTVEGVESRAGANYWKIVLEIFKTVVVSHGRIVTLWMLPINHTYC